MAQRVVLSILLLLAQLILKQSNEVNTINIHHLLMNILENKLVT